MTATGARAPPLAVLRRPRADLAADAGSAACSRPARAPSLKLAPGPVQQQQGRGLLSAWCASFSRILAAERSCFEREPLLHLHMLDIARRDVPRAASSAGTTSKSATRRRTSSAACSLCSLQCRRNRVAPVVDLVGTPPRLPHLQCARARSRRSSSAILVERRCAQHEKIALFASFPRAVEGFRLLAFGSGVLFSIAESFQMSP